MADFDPTMMEPPEQIAPTATLTPATGLAKAMWDAVLDPASPGPKAVLARMRRDAERGQ